MEKEFEDIESVLALFDKSDIPFIKSEIYKKYIKKYEDEKEKVKIINKGDTDDRKRR